MIMVYPLTGIELYKSIAIYEPSSMITSKDRVYSWYFAWHSILSLLNCPRLKIKPFQIGVDPPFGGMGPNSRAQQKPTVGGRWLCSQ